MNLQQRIEESRKKTKENLRKYEEQHKYCPECGSTSHSITYMCCMMDNDHPENYKDENIVVCGECGWRATKHDMVSYNVKET
jgi:transcription elongation factor Elf1